MTELNKEARKKNADIRCVSKGNEAFCNQNNRKCFKKIEGKHSRSDLFAVNSQSVRRSGISAALCS